MNLSEQLAEWDPNSTLHSILAPVSSAQEDHEATNVKNNAIVPAINDFLLPSGMQGEKLLERRCPRRPPYYLSKRGGVQLPVAASRRRCPTPESATVSHRTSTCKMLIHRSTAHGSLFFCEGPSHVARGGPTGHAAAGSTTICRFCPHKWSHVTDSQTVTVPQGRTGCGTQSRSLRAVLPLFLFRRISAAARLPPSFSLFMIFILLCVCIEITCAR